jgi:hypothetical protein
MGVNVPSTEMCWRWELTPAELFAGFNFQHSMPAKELPGEVLAFACSKKLLEGTPLTYQLALSDRSVAVDMQQLRVAHPELPLSGDRRSGVLAFDGDSLVGCCVIPGIQIYQGYKMVVLPEYRQQKLAFRMLLEWCRQTKRPRVLPPQGITINSAKALLAVHSILVDWAIQTGRSVPDQVRIAVAKGDEAKTLLEKATEIENLVLKQPSAKELFLVLGGHHG